MIGFKDVKHDFTVDGYPDDYSISPRLMPFIYGQKIHFEYSIPLNNTYMVVELVNSWSVVMGNLSVRSDSRGYGYGTFTGVPVGTYFFRLANETFVLKNVSESFTVRNIADVNTYELSGLDSYYDSGGVVSFSVRALTGLNWYVVKVYDPDGVLAYYRTFSGSRVWDVSFAPMGDEGTYVVVVFDMDGSEDDWNSLYETFTVTDDDIGFFPGLSDSVLMLMAFVSAFLAGIGVLVVSGSSAAFFAASGGLLFLFSRTEMGPLNMLPEALGVGLIVVVAFIGVFVWLSR